MKPSLAKSVLDLARIHHRLTQRRSQARGWAHQPHSLIKSMQICIAKTQRPIRVDESPSGVL